MSRRASAGGEVVAYLRRPENEPVLRQLSGGFLHKGPDGVAFRQAEAMPAVVAVDEAGREDERLGLLLALGVAADEAIAADADDGLAADFNALAAVVELEIADEAVAFPVEGQHWADAADGDAELGRDARQGDFAGELPLFAELGEAGQLIGAEL